MNIICDFQKIFLMLLVVDNNFACLSTWMMTIGFLAISVKFMIKNLCIVFTISMIVNLWWMMGYCHLHIMNKGCYNISFKQLLSIFITIYNEHWLHYFCFLFNGWTYIIIPSKDFWEKKIRNTDTTVKTYWGNMLIQKYCLTTEIDFIKRVFEYDFIIWSIYESIL